MTSCIQNLSPPPHSVHLSPTHEGCALGSACTFSQPTISSRAGEYLKHIGDSLGIGFIKVESAGSISLSVDSTYAAHVQGYRLEISDQGVRVIGHDEEGLFYGVGTFLQIMENAQQKDGVRQLPQLEIEDWPDFLHRGVLLDISRDKVPSLATLCSCVDRLAEWKLNQLQLYTEHTFAYKGHEVVWKNSSPMTTEDIIALDAYCRERYIELVPNQNSLAHMHRWLVHREYRSLAESPSEIDEHALATQNYQHEGNPGYSLCPTDPHTITLIEGLYQQLLPCFSSTQLNVGLDEAIDITNGGERSRTQIAARDSQEVYMDYLLHLYDVVKKFGKEKKIQFWADGVLLHQDLIDRLPRDTIPLLWGYEDGFPFELGKRFSSSGLQWYVCPSTCSWSSIGGRMTDAVHNLSQAAWKGRENGAIGYLITEWGDNGHLQPLGVSLPGILIGAHLAWNVQPIEKAEQLDVVSLLNRHLFKDRNGQMGAVACSVGDVYRMAIRDPRQLTCCSALFRLLVFNGSRPDDEVMAALSKDGLQQVGETLSKAKSALEQSNMEGEEAHLFYEEYALSIALLDWAKELGQLLLEHPGVTKLSQLPRKLRKELKKQLQPLIEAYEQIWSHRNREGGQKDSSRRLRHTLSLL